MPDTAVLSYWAAVQLFSAHSPGTCQHRLAELQGPDCTLCLWAKLVKHGQVLTPSVCAVALAAAD